jgi:hypothetical protein
MDVPVTIREIEYIPEWNENKKEQNPVRVTLRYLNTSQRVTLMPWTADAKGNAVMSPDMNGLIRVAVDRIDNLWQMIEGKREEIKTGSALLAAYGFEGLVIEIMQQIMGMNGREVEKNS